VTQRLSLPISLLALLWVALPALSAPKVAISSPQADATVTVDQAQVTVLYDAGEGRLLDQVELLIDGKVHALAEVNPPTRTGSVTLSWQVSKFVNGLHRLSVRGRDDKGELGDSGLTLLVDRGVQGTGAPVVMIERPKAGEIVSGTTEVKIRAFDPDGIKYVMLLVDDAFACLTNIPPFLYMWNTTRGYANGRHTLRAKAFDLGDNEGVSALVEVLVDNAGGRTELQTPETPASGEPVIGLDPAPAAEKPATEMPEPPAQGSQPAPAAPPAAEPTPAVPEPAATPAAPAALARAEATAAERSLPAARSTVASMPAASTVASTPAAPPAPAAKTVLTTVTASAARPQPAAKPVQVALAPAAPTTPVATRAASPAPGAPKMTTVVPVRPAAVSAGPTLDSVTAMPQAAVGAASLAQPAHPIASRTSLPATSAVGAVEPKPAVVPAAASAISAPRPSAALAAATNSLPAPQGVGAAVPEAARPASAASTLSAPSGPVSRTPEARAPGVQVAMLSVEAPERAIPAAKNTTPVSRPAAPTQHSLATPPSASRTPVGALAVEIAMAPAQVRTTTPAAPAGARGEPGLYLNDTLLHATEVPLISAEGLGLAPFRQVIEGAGGVVGWIPVERVVTARANDVDLRVTIGSRQALAGSRTILMDLPAFIKAGRTVVPVRFFRDALGYEVRYDAMTGAIYIAAR